MADRITIEPEGFYERMPVVLVAAWGKKRPLILLKLDKKGISWRSKAKGTSRRLEWRQMKEKFSEGQIGERYRGHCTSGSENRAERAAKADKLTFEFVSVSRGESAFTVKVLYKGGMMGTFRAQKSGIYWAPPGFTQVVPIEWSLLRRWLKSG